MNNYVGIDLGTTNSAICMYDGETVKLLKSPLDQTDTTPSAIFIDRRGNKYIGKRAYDNAARNPDNAATLFKRLMGTSTPVAFRATNETMTPEQCSAEILKTLYGYLPEEVRLSDPGTVITVPAAFNQMQKDATMAAAEMAGLGKVALMQEPVAAVMSVMRHGRGDGIFVVYDLGGGTLDIAVAQSISGRVSLLAHGGIAMCGGRDIDREIFHNSVLPWLIQNFDLAEDFTADRRYSGLRSSAVWATEKAKIQLSSTNEAVISLSDAELNVKDNSGNEIFIDVTITREFLDQLIEPMIRESVTCTQETLEKAGLSPHDVGRIVFVGGPTNYKPLRDKVAFSLGIAASTDVNPMTAVAEGAALFAESIDWSSANRGRKSSRAALVTGSQLNLTFQYQSRTPDAKAKLLVKLEKQSGEQLEFQIECLDTGWSSGRASLKDGITIDLPLSKPSENTFKIFVFDNHGAPISLRENKISITRTAAQVDAIPASHSIGIEALEKTGGSHKLIYLVSEGEQLPKRGKLKFRAMEALRAGAPGSINFKLWEGSIHDPISDNRFIGLFKIDGSDFSDGVIAKGAELICDYEILDSGNIVFEVTVPSIGGSFNSGRHFYSRQEGQKDYSKASRQIEEEAKSIANRLNNIAGKIDDPKLDMARERLTSAQAAAKPTADVEDAKKADEDIQAAKKLIAEARKANLSVIRQIELDKIVTFFNTRVREFARDSEANSFDNLTKTAQRSIDNNSSDFEAHLDELRGKNFAILWRQDWFVIDRFQVLAEEDYLFANTAEHTELCSLGRKALQEANIDKLRTVVAQLEAMRIGSGDEDDMIARSNIVAG